MLYVALQCVMLM